jgi:hypothetical protein
LSSANLALVMALAELRSGCDMAGIKATHVSPGQPIRPPTASFRNALVDLVNAGGMTGANPSGQHVFPSIRNNSGDTVPRFGILRVGGSIKSLATNGLAELQNCRVFEGYTPDVYSEPVAVVQQPIPDGGVGPCLINSGITPVIIELMHDTDTHCYPLDHVEYMRSGSSGCWRLLYWEEITYEDEEDEPEGLDGQFLAWAIVAYVGEPRMELAEEVDGSPSTEGFAPGKLLMFDGVDGVEQTVDVWLLKP